MGKKKKRRKAGHSNQGGGYKKFLHDLQEMSNQTNLGFQIREFPHEYKRLLYQCRVRIANPKAANALVTSRELKNIAAKTKHHYREQKIQINDISQSTYDLMLLYCLIAVRSRMLKKEKGENDPDAREMNEASVNTFTKFFNYFMAYHFRIIIQLSNPCYKYFGIDIRIAEITSDNPMIKLVTEIYGVPAQKLPMQIDGIMRPAYRLARPSARDPKVPVKWIAVDSSILGDYYKGQAATLEVYIQSHVMERLSQRLDLLDRAAINYLIWENTHTITQFEIHRDYLLLPVKLSQVKVGYLAGQIVDDKILFRTFLFITHRFTPEGDRLAELSGLDKQDITYWRIDRLSTFINLDEQQYRELLELFRQSGIRGFMKLKEQNFDIDQLQSVNFDGLMDYIKRGRQDDHRHEAEVMHSLQSG